MQPPDQEPTPEELTQLADGSLELRRRAEVEAWLVSSPGLAAEAAAQRRAVAALRAISVRAPARLRARVEGARDLGRVRRRRTRVAIVAGLAAGVAGLGLFVVAGGWPG